MKTSIFNLPSSNLLPSTKFDFCEASTLSIQGTNLAFRGSNPKGTNPSLVQGPTWFLNDTNLPGPQPTASNLQYEFNSSSRLPMSSSMSLVNDPQLSIHLVVSSRHQCQPCLLRRCHHSSSWYPNKISKFKSWGLSTMHHDFQGCLQSVFDMLPQELFKSSKYLTAPRLLILHCPKASLLQGCYTNPQLNTKGF